jgi:pilus assembly protein FimV
VGDDSPTINKAAADSEGPTVEQPGLPGGETIRQKLDVAGSKFGAPDQTAELALDDLGLDLSGLDDTDQPNLDDSRITRSLESAEAPTLVAGLDDESRRLINEARNAGGDGPTMLAPAPGASVSESGTWLFDDKAFREPPSSDTDRSDNPTMSMPSLPDLPDDASPTSKFRALEGNLDFDVDSLASTGRNESMSGTETGLDLDVGAPEPSETGTFAATQRIQHEDLGMPELEPATMSEVGTKLDLARAYMDMGDPEGARSILFEVLQEGSGNQKQEAQRLLDSIPG